MSNQASPSLSGRAVNPFTRLLDTIGSIWFGVVLMVLIFIYASVGSAVPWVRQGAMADWFHLEFLRFEKSEMEWFSWWPFVLLIVLFCLSIIVATVRRIALKLVNAGVWTIHLGIVIMAAACVYYFGSKVEGDTVLFQSMARIRVPGAPDTTMVIRPNASIVTGQYQLQVTRIDPAYVPLSGPLKGRRTQQIWFNVTSSSPPRNFIRTMLVGDPANTEDVIPGPQGPQRAVKVTGKKLVDENLQVLLDRDPVRYFYHSHRLPVRSNGAVYVRPSQDQDWTQLRVSWLPHHYEYINHRDELWPTVGEPLPPMRRLDMPAKPDEDTAWLKDIEVRVTDYLPYAKIESRYVEGGEMDPVNPVLRLRVGSDRSHDLVAADPEQQRVALMEGFNAEFAWADSADMRAQLVRKPEPRIKVQVPSKKIDRDLKLESLQGAGPVALDGTDYKIELREVSGPGQAMAHGPGMALLRVTKGQAAFDRVVIAGDERGGVDLDRLGQEPADTDIKFNYLDPLGARLLLVAGSDSDQVDVVLTGKGGSYRREQARRGEPIGILPAVPITVDALMRHARLETRPAMVPRSQRAGLGNVGKLMSLIRVEINDGQRIQSIWLPFNEYAFPDNQRAQPSRFSYMPRPVQLANGRMLWLMYSRQRNMLPSPIALDRFTLETYPGGDRDSDYISEVVFQEKNGGWSKPVVVRSNHPAEHGGLWYFQAMWDPQIEAHTVLGVGNRKGVGWMLAGVCISIAGMIYAFYVKPAIIRRRKQARAAVTAVMAGAIPATADDSSNDRQSPAVPRPSHRNRKSEEKLGMQE